MALCPFRCFLLLALWPNVYASCNDEQCDHTAWLQVHASEPEQPDEAELPKGSQEFPNCDEDDMGCVARKTACSLATMLSHDWPLSYSVAWLCLISLFLAFLKCFLRICFYFSKRFLCKSKAISEILGQLQDVCNGKPLGLTSETSGPQGVLEADDPDDLKVSSNVSLVGPNAHDECGAPGECTINVEEYEKENPGTKYGMKTAETVAKAAEETLKEILNNAKMIALRGNIAFTFIDSFIGFFFPSAGGLPENPCTYRSDDWGRCVWEQVKPFVQEFVSDQLDEAFETIWRATLDGYQTQLWALKTTASKNSEFYPNGTIKYMSDKTRDTMYDSLVDVHKAMLGDIALFMSGRAIKTTAGAYLSQFASLHVSVMTNVLGSWDHRTAGDRYVFQTIAGCYAQRVYEFATAALKSRMSTLEAHEEDKGTIKCCPVYSQCVDCPILTGEFKDTWKLECGWKNSGYSTACAGWVGACVTAPTMKSQRRSKKCYQNHYNEVQKQTVTFWQNWLAPIPIWLNNVVLMQEIEVHKDELSRDMKFDCSAF